MVTETTHKHRHRGDVQCAQLHHERHGHIRNGTHDTVRATRKVEHIQAFLHQLHEFFTQGTAVTLAEIE